MDEKDVAKQQRKAISYVIHNADRSKILEVLRPRTDKELPNVWGLPAGNLKRLETFEAAVKRSLMEKLGVRGDIVRFISEGFQDREEYVLFMKLYEVKITEGEPKVPQNIKGVTQYVKLRWGDVKDLKEATLKGSLCCRLYLESEKVDFRSG